MYKKHVTKVSWRHYSLINSDILVWLLTYTYQFNFPCVFIALHPNVEKALIHYIPLKLIALILSRKRIILKIYVFMTKTIVLFQTYFCKVLNILALLALNVIIVDDQKIDQCTLASLCLG
jgi:hypothetical protein